MSSFIAKLNLRPQERRLIVFVAVVVFVVLNIWLVWPHFKDWNRLKGEYEKALIELRKYQTEIGQIPKFEAKLRELENAEAYVIPEEQDLDLSRTVQNQTRVSGVLVTSQDARPKTTNTRTNQFFEEQTLTMRIEARNEELVKFLVSLASTNSLIRVQELGLRPDNPANPMKLFGNVTLVASYQKSPPVKPVSPAASTNATASPKPALPRPPRVGASPDGDAKAVASKTPNAPTP